MTIETLMQGDCLDVLKTMESNSIESVVTDPPYGLSKEPDINEVLSKWLAGEEYDHRHGGFMGKSWDSFVPHPDIWREVFRVLKPGGHALVFAGTRTQDLMTISLRLAGFEVRDVIEWLYFSGFPKSYNISKGFDRRAGAERKVVGNYTRPDGTSRPNQKDWSGLKGVWGKGSGFDTTKNEVTAPATELARKWDGWGTALKPAHEPIIVVRKPLHDGRRKLTVVDCVEKYGTGAINIDATRIGGDITKRTNTAQSSSMSGSIGEEQSKQAVYSTGSDKGRFPANIATTEPDAFWTKYSNVSPQELSKKASKKDRNSDWQGEEITLEERGAGGLQGRANGSLGKTTYNRNHHPTVKPTDLMAWLVRLITPKNGTVLDPFAGSGSTLVAAKREGFGFIGIEREEEYVEIAAARVGEGGNFDEQSD